MAVSIDVAYASGFTVKDFACTTAADGSCSVSWTIGSNADPGTFMVSAQVGGQEFGSSFVVD